MKRTKKNNKGFSLVELIVVVLIMAIIAVALAPQVMKWVGKSRTATNIQVYDGLVSNCQTALTDETAWKDCSTATFTVKITTAGVDFGTAPDSFKTAVGNIVDTSKMKVTSGSYEIEIVNGKVNRKTEPTPDPS